ncbi:MAG: lactonase family protein [Terracidiphilus sp.]|nr:lactonase family protein [Terracidiphilus sp.]
MGNLTRRSFLITASAATLAAAATPGLAASRRTRVFVGSNTPEGILAYDWDPVTAELAPAGVAAKLANVDWITYSPGREFLYAASEVDSFNGKPTGAVASFKVENGQLHPLSARNSASVGTCHVALDHSGRVLLSADYGGGSAASFLVKDGQLSEAVWTEYYTGHGPVSDRQQSAHAHFASFSPDNRFAYINDLGSDCIHIYSLNAATAALTPAGVYRAKAGAGPRTLRFHPNGRTAYSVNELASTVDVLTWSAADGSLTRLHTIDLLPEGFHGLSRACDTVITRDGRNVYFANRDKDFLYSFRADAKTGSLTPIGRTNCGGKIPRNFVLDPTERWMLVANQDSNLISVFARNPQTGALAEEGKSIAAAAPMCILFA